MKRWSFGRFCLLVSAGLLAWLVAAHLCLFAGSTGFHWPRGREWDFRCESVVVASLVGAALGAAGTAYQAVLRNPLADPYLLGASSGAALAAYIWRLPALTAILALGGTVATEAGQQAFAFVGSLAAVAVVLAITTARSGTRRLDPVTLLLVGVIVNAVCGAVYLLLNAIHKDIPGGGGEIGLLVGGIGHVTTVQFTCAAIFIAAGVLTLFWLAGPLAVAALEDDEARALGVRIGWLRWVALAAASLVTAAAVAISGPIAFVGLICPHVARRLVGPDQRRLLPVATAAGAILLCVADAVSRGLAQQELLGSELQVGILTGLLGGPFFLLLLMEGDGK
jgi:iron complex transport system permease protein